MSSSRSSRSSLLWASPRASSRLPKLHPLHLVHQGGSDALATVLRVDQQLGLVGTAVALGVADHLTSPVGQPVDGVPLAVQRETGRLVQRADTVMGGDGLHQPLNGGALVRGEGSGASNGDVHTSHAIPAGAD